MKKSCSKLVASLAITLFVFSINVLQGVPKGGRLFSQVSLTSDSNQMEVRFCDLISNPARYERELVRMRASFASTTPDWVALYDLSCAGKNKPPRDKYIRPKLDCDDEKSCQYLRDTIDRNLELHPSGSWRAEFVITGKLEIQKSDYSNTFTANFPLVFAIKTIEQATRIPPEIPMPWDP
jgi:hypothetical protein